LLPVVSREQGPFCGYQVGEVVSDHDVALGYVLERHPQALPSYAGLPPAQQASVKFTQCNMEYNMGWLVQAEAPPGPLFRKFRSIIRSGKASQRDIAFYFSHWLTDLAGAEPCPLEGCEKFVLKFPQKVLTTFLCSLPFVQKLSDKSETEVFEEYLIWRWKIHEPALGPVVTGVGCTARLRLAVMAQHHATQVLDAFATLPREDMEVLCTELGRTGCADQAYSQDKTRRSNKRGGPAFLVYYAPALLSRNCGTDAVGALSVLAEVLRQGRALWPLQDNNAGENVTIRVDALKDLDVETMRRLESGAYWALQRMSAVDAIVVKRSMLGTDGRHSQVNWATQRLLFLGVSSAGPDGFVSQHKTVSFDEGEVISL